MPSRALEHGYYGPCYSTKVGRDSSKTLPLLLQKIERLVLNGAVSRGGCFVSRIVPQINLQPLVPPAGAYDININSAIEPRSVERSGACSGVTVPWPVHYAINVTIHSTATVER